MTKKDKTRKMSVTELNKIRAKLAYKELKETRERCDEHSFWFFEYIESFQQRKFFTRDKWHAIIISWLFDMLDRDEIQRITVSMAPRFGKSYITTRGLQWQIGKHPDRSNARNSYSASLAVDTLSFQVREMIKDKEFLKIYPEAELDPNARKKDRWYLRKKTRPAYAAAGINGSLSGIGVDNWLILDDEYSGMEQALSKAVRRQTDNWVESVHLKRIEKGFKEMYFCTRWTKYDRIGQMKSENYNYEIDILKWKEKLEEKEITDERFESLFQKFRKTIKKEYDTHDAVVSLTIPALIEEDGEEKTACNAINTTRHYLRERSRQMNKGMGFIWNAVSMQNPQGMDDRLISDLKRFKFDNYLSLVKYYNYIPTIASIDPAFGGGDYFAMPIAKVIEGKAYIVDVIYSKEKPNITRMKIVEKIKKHNIKRIRIEGNNGGTEYASALRAMLLKRGINCSVRVIRNNQDKVARIVIRSGDIQEKCLFLSENEYPRSKNNEYQNFILEVLAQDNMLGHEHDDAVDSLAELVQMNELYREGQQGGFEAL